MLRPPAGVVSVLTRSGAGCGGPGHGSDKAGGGELTVMVGIGARARAGVRGQGGRRRSSRRTRRADKRARGGMGGVVASPAILAAEGGKRAWGRRVRASSDVWLGAELQREETELGGLKTRRGEHGGYGGYGGELASAAAMARRGRGREAGGVDVSRGSGRRRGGPSRHRGGADDGGTQGGAWRPRAPCAVPPLATGRGRG